MTVEAKRLLVKSGVKGNCHTIYYENGGEVPTILTGLYTSVKEADAAIQLYLATKKKKVDDSNTSK